MWLLLFGSEDRFGCSTELLLLRKRRRLALIIQHLLVLCMVTGSVTLERRGDCPLLTGDQVVGATRDTALAMRTVVVIFMVETQQMQIIMRAQRMVAT